MKIRMVEQRTGPRWDDRPWPGVGGEIDVDDEEGAAICAAGWAVPVPSDPKVETRAESPAEAPAAAEAAVPPQTAPKAAWIAYAASRGLPEEEAAGLSKADLVSRYG